MPSQAVFESTYKGSDSTVSLQSIVNTDDDPIVKFSLLQSISQNWAIGGENTLNLAGDSTTEFGARYADAGSMWSLTASKSVKPKSVLSFKLSTLKQVDSKVALAAQMKLIPARKDAQFTFGWEFNLTQARLNATVNSKWQVMATMMQALAPGFAINYSAILDHSKGAYRFGMGLNMG